MIIRKAIQSDIDGILDLVMSFYKEGLNKSELSFNPVSLRETIDIIIQKHIFLVAENKRIGGVIAGLLSPSIFDYNQKILEEKIWFVDKTFRGTGISIRLFKEFERIAKECGVDVIIMAHMVGIMPDNVSGIYNSFGYKQIESHYTKSIGG
jgi:N-acetylglutamate synthase-like GNAT family acetyltransferase